MNETSPLPLIVSLVVLFPLAFALFWSTICYLLAWVGGWQRLARHYRTARVPAGPTIGGFWAMLGMVSYRGTLTLQAAPEGLYLSIMILFRPGHPPLLIPWSAIKREGTAAGALFRWLTLELGDPKITTLRLPAGQVDEAVLARYLGSATR